VPHRDWRLRVEDIVVAIEKVLAYTRGMDLTTFEATAKASKRCTSLSPSARPARR